MRNQKKAFEIHVRTKRECHAFLPRALAAETADFHEVFQRITDEQLEEIACSEREMRLRALYMYLLFTGCQMTSLVIQLK